MTGAAHGQLRMASEGAEANAEDPFARLEAVCWTSSVHLKTRQVLGAGDGGIDMILQQDYQELGSTTVTGQAQRVP